MGDKRLLRELGRVSSGRGFGSSFFWMGLALTGVLTFTGAWLFFVEDLDHFDMSLLLVHILGGFPFFIPCVMLAKRHYRYASIMGKRRFAALGWFTVVALSFAFGTGVFLTFVGVTGQYWIWLGHAVVGVLGAVAMFVYIAWVLKAFKINLPSTERAMRFFWQVTREFSFRVATLAVLLVIASGAGAWYYQEPPRDLSVPDYEYVAEDDAFFPSRATTEHGGFYNPEPWLNSDSCGQSGCHEATLRQWRDSVHYLTPTPVFAAVQGLFMEEARKGEFLMERRKLQVEDEREIHAGEESFRFCAGCHTPVALFAGEIGVGQGLPTFEEREGSSCVFCHRIEATGEKNEGGGGDYRVSAAPNRYLFAYSDSAAGQWMNKTLINAKPEHHKNMFMKPMYADSEYCIGCHKRLQYSYWKESVYADPDHEDYATCQDCHFRDVEVHDDVSAIEDGVVADHRSLAANLVTPKIYGLEEQYRLTLEFMRDENQELDLVVPEVAEPGSEVDVLVRVINAGAGHLFPTGPESDLLEAWTELVVWDASGEPLYEYGLLDERGYLDHEETYVYEVRPFDADGNMMELDKHRSWLFAEDRMQVIKPKQYDERPFVFVVPEDADGPLTLRCRLRFRKFNQQFLDFAASAGFMERIEAPVVDLHVFETTIELTTDPERLAADEARLVAEVEAGVEGYDKKPSFDEYLINHKLPLEDKITLSDAKALYQEQRYEEALALWGTLSEHTRDRPKFQRLHDNLLAAVEESEELEAIEVAPFD